jgi:thiol-disulfide isomerase/thioredoxin
VIYRILVIGLLLVSSNISGADGDTPKLVLPKGILPVADRVAPPLLLSDVDDGQFNLAEQKGRWVFVHFWASWCGPCRREIPAIQRLLEKNNNKSLVFAIINTAESEDTIFNFLGVLAPDIVSLMDRDGLVTEAWEPRGLPSTYLVDPAGIIRYQALGGRPWDKPEYMKFLSALSVGKSIGK